MSKRIQKALTLEQKQRILNEVDDGKKKKTEIAASYGIPKSTLSTILKNRANIEASYATCQFEPERKRMRLAKNEDVEIALMRWITEARNQNLTLTGGILREKVCFFADALNAKEFHSSTGWLQRFKDRHGIVCKKVCGEEASVSLETTDTFFAEKLPFILTNFEARDIFNADETGLFWKALPNRTLCLKSLKCSGGKSSKLRITVLVACNMDGSEKLPLLVIGKSAKPRCFKGVRTLPVTYEANKKAWMMAAIFTKWLVDLDKKYAREKRKICLILDNCTAHCDVAGLKSITLLFLPPNTTSKLQPCDQGIIRVLKSYYRREMIRRAINCFDNKKNFEINILEAMTFVRSAWRSVTQKTIKNCFHHAGFVSNDTATEGDITGNESETIPIEMLITEAQERGVIPESASFDEYVSMDDATLTSETLTEAEIVDSVLNRNSAGEVKDDFDASTDEEDSEVVMPMPSLSEASTAIDTLRSFLLSQENSLSELNRLDEIQEFWSSCRDKNKKEKRITDFFT